MELHWFINLLYSADMLCLLLLYFIRFKGIAHPEMAKSHVFVLMQISYSYIVWNNFPKFQENRASNFWDMRQSMCVIVVSP